MRLGSSYLILLEVMPSANMYISSVRKTNWTICWGPSVCLGYIVLEILALVDFYEMYILFI